jgi:hypothetical protein
MANPTMTLIGTPVVAGSGGLSSVTFSSIPSTYTDLVLRISARTDRSYPIDQLKMSFNGVSSGYSYIDADSQGSSPYFGGSSSASVIYSSWTTGATATANTFGNVEIYIPNYTSSYAKSALITGVSENNSATSYINLVSGVWSYSGQPAITSINFVMDVGTIFTQYSSFYLYGINNS